MGARLGALRGAYSGRNDTTQTLICVELPQVIGELKRWRALGMDLSELRGELEELRQWRKLGCDPQDVEDICWCQATGKRKVISDE